MNYLGYAVYFIALLTGSLAVECINTMLAVLVI